MLRSMTGFGRCFVESPLVNQQWEIRSVNGRYLDIKWRLPQAARCLEPSLEKTVRRHASRGRLDIALTLDFPGPEAPGAAFDARLAEAMLNSVAALAARRGDAFTPDYTSLLAIPYLWREQNLEDAGGGEDFGTVLERGLVLALEDWNESREAEGAQLGRDLEGRVAQMESWTAIIAASAPEIREERIGALRERLQQILSGCEAELEEGRFLQEIVILTDRLDVSEELTRLVAHLDRMRRLLGGMADAGRKLDFTLQECFREINTCGNKLQDADLAAIVADFKNELEKCREQAQNLE